MTHTIEEVQAMRRMGEEMVQRDRVLADLADAAEYGDGVCGTEWLRDFIPRYSTHIHTLRKEGYTIVNEDCTAWEHEHRTRQVRFVMTGRPGTLGSEWEALDTVDRQLTMMEDTHG